MRGFVRDTHWSIYRWNDKGGTDWIKFGKILV